MNLLPYYPGMWDRAALMLMSLLVVMLAAGLLVLLPPCWYVPIVGFPMR